MKHKSTYWLPTERSPWAVIYYCIIKNQWRYLGTRETRKEARALARFLRISGDCKTRVRRVWIPLR